MRILVTGGAGFIGSNFILYWMKKNPADFVVNLDVLTYAGNTSNLKSVELSKHYAFVKGDICDFSVVDRVMHGVDVVVHFAAETHVDRSILGPSVFIQSNIIGTNILLDVALKHKVKRFHHVSTDEVFGSLDLGEKRKFSEETPYNPRSPYAASKAASDHLVRAYYHTYGLPITITNCSNNFGPFQFPEKFISLLITNIIEDKHIPIYGDGLHERDWLYVLDHCRAIELVLKKGKIGETYCVGGGVRPISNLEVAKKILKILKKDVSYIDFVEDRLGHDRRYAIDFSKIKKELGWKPMQAFDKWLVKTVEWYKKNKDWWVKVKDGEYRKFYKENYGKGV